MESQHLVWSATSCDYPGAALFFGLARYAEIVSLCSWRTKRQLVVYPGPPVQALGARMLPTFYLAIRDPSCVKVKTVTQPLRVDEVRYVSLIFERDRQVDSAEAAAQLRHDGGGDAVFVITVSLPVAREELFSREVLPQSSEDWPEMFERLCHLGHRR